MHTQNPSKEDFFALAQTSPDPQDNAYQLQYLDMADFASQKSCLDGIRPVLYYQLINSRPDLEPGSYLWTRLFQTARAYRQIPLAIKALTERAQRLDSETYGPHAWMALGHYFRFAAHQYADSARAYAKAAGPEQTDALCAILALQRLLRDAPDCVQAQEAMAHIRSQGLVPTQEREILEAQLGKIDPKDTSARSHALIELAKVMIVCWGDASRALDWLEAAYYLKCDPSLLTPVCTAIAAAMPNNTPTLTRALDFLIKCRAWRTIDQIARLSTCLDFVPADFEPFSMTLSMVYALQLNDEIRAASELFNAALRNPVLWANDIRQRAWVCIYAADHDIFRRALFDGLALVGQDDLYTDVIAFYEKFGRSQQLRKHAVYAHLRQSFTDNNLPEVERIIQHEISTKTVANDPEFYEILLDMASYLDSPESIQRNQLILKLAGQIFDLDNNAGNYRTFLTNMLEIVSGNTQSEHVRRLHKQTIEMLARLNPELMVNTTEHSSGIDFNLVQNTPAPSVNVMEIMTKSSELKRPSVLDNFVIDDIFRQSDFSISFESLADPLSSPVASNHPAEPSTSALSALSDNKENSVLSPEDSEKCRLFFDEIRDLPAEEKMVRLSAFDEDLMGFVSTGSTQPDDSLRWIVYRRLVTSEDTHLPDGQNPDDQQWQTAAETLLRYLPFTPSPDSVATWIADICRLNLKPNAGFELLCNHFQSCLKYDVLFEQVLRMSENDNQKQQMLDRIDDAIATFAGDASQLNALYIKKYKIAEILGDENTRLTCLKLILENNPDAPFAHEALSQIVPDQLMVQSRILYYQLQIAIQHDSGKKRYFQEELLKLYIQSGQPSQAISLYHSMIEEYPDDLNARNRLIDLLISQENWKSAENALLALINVETSAESKYQNLIKLADIQNNRMLMPSRALLTLFAALDVDPFKINLMHPTFCEISEQLRSFTPLIDKYEDLIKHNRFAEIRRTAAMHLARIYQNYLKKPALACNVLDDFYRQEGARDPEFLRDAAAFYGDMRHWNGYVKTISQLLPQTSDNRERVQLALAAAHVYAENLGDHAKASQAAIIAAQSEPQTAAQWLEITDFLLAGESTPEAIFALSQGVELEQDPAKKAILQLELARQYTMADDLEDATDTFHLALQFSPSLDQITPVAEEIIAHATAQKNKEAFILVCNDLISSCPPSEQTSLLLQQALTLLQVFHDADTAKRIVDENTTKMTAIDLDQSMILVQILTLLGEHDAAIRLLQNIMKEFVLDEAQQETCLKSLMNNAAALGDAGTIQITTNAILARSPGDTDARFYQIMLDHDAGRWDQLSAKIQNLLPDIELLSAEKAMLVHFYYGELMHASQRDDLALESLDNALRIRMDFRPAVDLKLTILLEKQRWSEALPVFHLLLNLTNDPEEKGAIHKRIAEIYHFYMNDSEKAIHEYEYAVTLGGDVEDVPVRLLQLYSDTEQWDKAALTAQILAQAQIDTPNAKCDYLIALAKIQYEHLKQYPEAIQNYTEAWNIRPLDPEIIEPLTEIHVRNKSWEDLESVVQKIADNLKQSPEESIARLKWISQKCGKMQRVVPILNRVQDRINLEKIAVNLSDFANKPDPLWLTQLRDLKDQNHTNILKPQDTSEDKVIADDEESIKKIVASDNPAKGIAPLRDITASIPPISSLAKLPSVTHLRLPTASLETVIFSLDDLHKIEQSANKNNDTFTLLCLEDFFKHAGLTYKKYDLAPYPESISENTLQSILTIQGNPGEPDLIRVLSVMATAHHSPLLDPLPENYESDRPELNEIYQQFKSFLMAPSIQLCSNATGNPDLPLLNTQPPCIRCLDHKMSSVSIEEWRAKMAYSILLSRPESKLLFSMPMGQLAHELIEISSVLRNPGQYQTTLSRDKIDLWRSALATASILPTDMPAFGEETLSKLKALNAHYKRMAIQGALLLSQSLTATLKLLCEIENCRCPSSVATLKSAMKKSQPVKSLVLFALSANAQSLYEKIYQLKDLSHNNTK